MHRRHGLGRLVMMGSGVRFPASAPLLPLPKRHSVRSLPLGLTTLVRSGSVRFHQSSTFNRPFEIGRLAQQVENEGERSSTYDVPDREAIVLTCSSCGAVNPDGFKFCGECGQALALRAAHPEERKFVTTLFCDLVGSTALGEDADPEDVDILLRRYNALARETVESCGGVVEKFIGDAVVAVFGVPAAHEDDAERAVRAGLKARAGRRRPAFGRRSSRTGTGGASVPAKPWCASMSPPDPARGS